jgi:hypothetical protein
MECFDLVGVDGEGDCDMVLNERYMLGIDISGVHGGSTVVYSALGRLIGIERSCCAKLSHGEVVFVS